MPTLFIDTIFTCRATHLWIDQSGRWTWDSWRWRTSSSSSLPGGTPSVRHPAPCAGNMSGINLGINQIFTINSVTIFSTEVVTKSLLHFILFRSDRISSFYIVCWWVTHFKTSLKSLRLRKLLDKSVLAYWAWARVVVVNWSCVMRLMCPE